MSDLLEIQRVFLLLKKLNPHIPDEELNKHAKSLYELALFLVRHKIKEHSKTSQSETTELAPKQPP